MEFILADILLAPIGWLFLIIRYRDKKKVREILKNEYDGSYANAAKDTILNAFILCFGLMIIVLILITIVTLFI
ncbi:MAG: hypothetical protein MJK07_16100 [Flavobacteriales bacterium]|nr:hypothetical protein [Flavobacteriales bacterium]